MPEMDGLTAMREIRKRAEWKKLPIIALTAKAMRDDQEQCLEAGANDYIAKPIDVEKLLSLVRVWMPQRGRGRQATARADDAATGDIELQLLLEAIYLNYHYDFRGYAARLAEAAAAARRCRASAAPRCRSCRTACCTSRRCSRALLEYLTVQVSEMFRDPAYFLALREQRGAAAAHLSVAEGLGGRLQHRRGGLLAGDPAARGRPARAHAASTPPTSTRRAAEGRGRRLHARPRSPASPRTTAARARERRSPTTTPRPTARAVFDKSLRKHIVFSDHSLATDSVFAEVQLVSCRNVLIYFDRDAAGPRARPVPRGAVPQGFLGLGSQRDAALLGARRRLRRARPRRAASTRSGTSA